MDQEGSSYMAKSQKSLLSGMTVLGAAGIICKLIGMLFNVPLAWLLDDNGLGIFQSVYPTYNLLLTVSSAGLPVAVSRMVAHTLAKDDPRNARRVFHAALYLLAALGCICTILILAFSVPLTRLVNQPESQPGFLAIAPCVAIVCLLSAFRGFMQGQQDMVPTAVSQLIEQGAKVIIALPLAYLGTRQSQAMGAAGALLGITLCESLALLYMIILYYRRRNRLDSLPQNPSAAPASHSALAGQLLQISIPITIGACIVPLAQFVDSAMLVSRMMVSGVEAQQAGALYGLFHGLVIRLINIPTALALSISMSLMPAIASSVALDDQDAVRQGSSMGIRFAFLIGMPCSIGMSLLSKQVLYFFYSTARSAQQLQTASELLQFSSLTVVLFTVVQATSAILQGLHKQRIPMYTLVLGVGMKILLNYVLVGMPGVNIHGAPIASIVCYAASMIPNLYFVCKHARMRFDWKGWVLLPAAATACMGAVILLLRNLLPINHLTTILEILIGVAVYLAAALAIGALKKEELSSLRRKRRKA